MQRHRQGKAKRVPRRRRHSPALYEKKYNGRGYKLIAGVDEVGVGPWAGPVVAAAVILRDFRFKVRIYDSKALSPRCRQSAFSEIKDKAYTALGIVDADTIDKINIYNATRLAMERAISALRPRPDYVLVDGRQRPAICVPSESIVRGDRKSISIAAASIIAKVVRDRIMQDYDKVYPGYEFARHKGYGTEKHRLALERLGPCLIHRRSFKPLKIGGLLLKQ